MKRVKSHSLLVLIALLLPVVTVAQSTEYTVEESSTMIIKGTSTIHDWEADVEEMDISVAFNPELLSQETPAVPVTELAINVAVESIESGKGGMNRRINGALKEKDHPEIMFNMISAELADTVQSVDAFTFNLRGNLNVAGFVREIEFPVTGTKVGENSYRFEGSYGLNMTDYEVDPPSAMLGTIKSGEEVTIEFNVVLNRNLSQAQSQ